MVLAHGVIDKPWGSRINGMAEAFYRSQAPNADPARDSAPCAARTSDSSHLRTCE